MRALLSALAIPLFALSAHAGELPQDPMVQLLIRGESAPIDMGSDYLVGFWDGLLLADKAASMKATVRTEGKGDYSFVCTTGEGRTVWFLSDASNYDGEPVVTAMVNTPASAEGIACDPVQELDPDPWDSTVPGIGASAKELAQRFGEIEDISEEGTVAFRSHDSAGDGGNYWELIKTVTYHLTDEVVDAVAYELVTVN